MRKASTGSKSDRSITERAVGDVVDERQEPAIARPASLRVPRSSAAGTDEVEHRQSVGDGEEMFLGFGCLPRRQENPTSHSHQHVGGAARHP